MKRKEDMKAGASLLVFRKVQGREAASHESMRHYGPPRSLNNVGLPLELMKHFKVFSRGILCPRGFCSRSGNTVRRLLPWAWSWSGDVLTERVIISFVADQETNNAGLNSSSIHKLRRNSMPKVTLKILT